MVVRAHPGTMGYRMIPMESHIVVGQPNPSARLLTERMVVRAHPGTMGYRMIPMESHIVVGQPNPSALTELHSKSPGAYVSASTAPNHT